MPAITKAVIAQAWRQGLCIGMRSCLAGLAMSAAAVAANAAPAGIDATTAFEWAEWKYPSLFPAGPASQPLDYQGQTYSVRSYATGNLIGIAATGDVLGYGPFTGNSVQGFGTLASLAPAIEPDICSFRPAACPGPASPQAGRLSVAGATPGHSYVLALLPDDSVIGWTLDMNDPRGGSGERIPGTVSARHVGIKAKAIAAGPSYAMAIGPDGVVRGWGIRTRSSPLGGETMLDVEERITTPVPTAFPNQIVSIATVGLDFALAVRADGTVWYLPGSVTNLGGGKNRIEARKVEGIGAVRSVHKAVGGSRRSIAIGTDGTVWELLLGFGTGGYRATASAVAGLPPAADAACGPQHCLALASNGTVWAWGQNIYGSLGNGSTVPSSTPIQVAGLPAIVAIAAGDNSSHAVAADGRLWNWGHAAAAGMGQVSGSLTRPTLLPGLDQIREVSVGSAVLVRRAGGSVWGWGPNYTDELGNGLTIYSATPVQARLIDLE